MKNFIKYAEYYNLLYKDKNYRTETDYVHYLIKRYSGRHCKTLLDIGCGTGNHDVLFAEKGYTVTGIDKSRAMIAIARNRAALQDGVEFRVSDVSDFSLHKKFDIAISLFHVISYLVTNNLVKNSLKNIHDHLKDNGLFIFDFWYGPAVLAQKPVRKTKTVSERNISIRRIAAPKINLNENMVDVKYKVVASDNNGAIKIIEESHKMRYFFLPELEFMLKQADFRIIKNFKWLSKNEGLSPKSWSGIIIAKRG